MVNGDLLLQCMARAVGFLLPVFVVGLSVSEDARGGRMNPHRAFVRKVSTWRPSWRCCWCRCSVLGHPATSGSEAGEGHAGGLLAQLRQDRRSAQPDELGQIDLTSETIKLATLGMRGVAADILWTKASKYQMKKDWTNLSATLEQITKVQPNFIEPWIHQAWNLSYNVSAAFDDFPRQVLLAHAGHRLSRRRREAQRTRAAAAGRDRLVHLLQDRQGRPLAAIPPPLQGRRRFQRGRCPGSGATTGWSAKIGTPRPKTWSGG